MGDFGKIYDLTKFRNEGGGIYAFKPQPDRYLSFFTEGKKIMETTFDQCINRDSKRKEQFDKEYQEFLLSELVLEKMESEPSSVRTLAQKAGVSPHHTAQKRV